MPGANTFKVICESCYRECAKCVKPIFSIGLHVNTCTNTKISTPLLISLHTYYCQVSCCKVSQIKLNSNEPFNIVNSCIHTNCSPDRA